jgi:hypothetical protein
MENFKEFVDKKQRDAVKHLKIIKAVLAHEGMHVESFFDDDPHIFVNSHNRNLSFDGIRIYEIGGSFAFRVQKERDTHPYGRAYPLDIEEMFNDFISEDGNEEKAGKRSMGALSHELKKFFKDSEKAEKIIRAGDILDRGEDEDGVLLRPTGSDYSVGIK